MWYFCDMQCTERSLWLCTSLPKGSGSFPEEAGDLQRVLGLVRCFSFWGRPRLVSYWQRCDELSDLSWFPPRDQAGKKPVTPVVTGDQAEQTGADKSGVFAAPLVRPWALSGPKPLKVEIWWSVHLCRRILMLWRSVCCVTVGTMSLVFLEASLF